MPGRALARTLAAQIIAEREYAAQRGKGQWAVVTPEDVTEFANEAFRNWTFDELSPEGIEDVRAAMQAAVDRIVARATPSATAA